MKRALYFTTKLNSRDIKKCNCFWVPSYDLFASARKAVFPAPTGLVVVYAFSAGRQLWRQLGRAQEEDVSRVYPVRVELKYMVRGQGIETYYHDWQ